jgi:hypothetical protein
MTDKTYLKKVINHAQVANLVRAIVGHAIEDFAAAKVAECDALGQIAYDLIYFDQKLKDAIGYVEEHSINGLYPHTRGDARADGVRVECVDSRGTTTVCIEWSGGKIFRGPMLKLPPSAEAKVAHANYKEAIESSRAEISARAQEAATMAYAAIRGAKTWHNLAKQRPEVTPFFPEFDTPASTSSALTVTREELNDGQVQHVVAEDNT